MKKDDQLLLAYGKIANVPEVGPVAGQLELTSRCYQACLHCESWREARDHGFHKEFTLGQVTILFLQMDQLPAFQHLTLTGGDPQIWEDFPELLVSYGEGGHVLRFNLGISTVLARTVRRPDLWLSLLSSVRVSLDSVNPETYSKIRGGTALSPSTVLDRLGNLGHSNISTLTTVYPENVSEMFEIYKTLSALGEGVVRKAIFLPVIGTDRLDQKFWEEFEAQRRKIIEGRISLILPHNLDESENPQFVRERIEDEIEGDDYAPCRIGNLGFHIKSNGDYYPCCLTGGEALKTEKSFLVGSVHDSTLRYLHRLAFDPHGNFQRLPGMCREICQYKQHALNTAANRVANTRLAIP